MDSIIAKLRAHAADKSAGVAYTVIDETGAEQSITFSDLYHEATKIAANLRQYLNEGQRVGLLMPTSLDYIKAFYGCLLGGLIAVPLYPPTNPKSIQRLTKIIADSQSAIALTTHKLAEELSESWVGKPVKFMCASDISKSSDMVNHSASFNTYSIAFLQYTSGSTGDPKGVTISHRNIIANIKAVTSATKVKLGETFCSWLPLHHDMGLVVSILTPLYLGGHSVIMSPTRFIRRPRRWLEAISHYKAVYTASPNFAFDYCVDRVTNDSIAGLDLTSWRIAANGAEPVNAKSIAAFAEKFSVARFSNKAVYPCYGMAEATVFVSGGDSNSAPVTASFKKLELQQGEVVPAVNESNAVCLVACGAPQEFHDLRIVDPEQKEELKDLKVGEIWFAGPSVSDGYWNKVEETSESFGFSLAGHQGYQYLRTGDLGFKYQGELYITGRIKDLIIVKGKNYYPNDLERGSANIVLGLSSSAAFEVDGKVVIIYEVARKFRKNFDGIEARQAIRAEILNGHEILIDEINFVAAGQLPVTSSGKIQRRLVKQLYLNNEFSYLLAREQNNKDVVSQMLDSGTQKKIEETWKALFDREQVGVNDVVVMALANGEGDERLVAYVTHDDAAVMLSDDGSENENQKAHTLRHDFIDGLKTTLAKDLPDYMVPSVFVVLEQLPLTPNGKVDRKGLPAPDMSLQQQSYVAPTTETERQLCAIWQDVLDLEQVGITDNFFELGGHSLLATRLMSLINSRLGVEVPLKRLFNAPTIADFSLSLMALKPGLERPRITLVSREQDLQPSFAQQRLWLLDKIDGGSAHYNMPGALRLTGELNTDELIKAISTIVERHESLRTYFAEGADGQPVQIIRPFSGIEVPLTDISTLSKSDREVDLAELVSAEAAKAFDLSADAMLRAQLIKVSADEHMLLVTMHHIASDGWSMGILINELSALYGATVRGQKCPLPPLEIQYADYAQWQRDYLQGEVLEEQLGYWDTQLAGLPVVHGLPLDKVRPQVQSFSGASHSSVINSKVNDKLKRLCQGVGGTLFMGLHAAFSVLLSRYSNETDIVIGSPIANREQAEVAGLIGFFVNTLVLRSNLSGSPSFSALLEQSRETLLDAYAHQQVPFEQLVERLKPERSLSHSPLFQVMLVLQNNEEGALELPGLSLSPVAQASTVAKYDLTLTVTEREDGLQLGWEYNTDLFNADTIQRLAKHFELLLTGLVKQPQESVFSIEMLPEAELHQQLIEWNDTQADYPKDTCIHELFEQQVSANPNSVAVVFEDSQLTYGELNQQANQLAHYLVEERQVTPDTLVGICVERSLDMIVGIMAILKAGGAYVPLDPSYPAARLAYMLDDANLSTVLTQTSLQGQAPVSETQAVYLDSDEVLGQLQTYPSDNVIVKGLTSSHLAYVIYTSGSTGNPKGVMVERDGVRNLLHWYNKEYGYSNTDNFLIVSAIGFDLTQKNIFSPLISGGSVVLFQQHHYDAKTIIDVIKKHEVSVVNCAPSLFYEVVNLAEKGGFKALNSLRYVLFGGEAINEKILSSWMSSDNFAVNIVNMYGPTEGTDIVSASTQGKLIKATDIGAPIDNVQRYVLGDNLLTAPTGVAGELHVGGAGLARGYLNRPDLTAEKFIPNPFYDATNPSSSERLYKTGDLVRYLPGGNLEFLGRIDHQVKIRGFRIELGEIEHQLLAHDEVNDAVVVALANDEGDKRLVAYVTHDDAAAMLSEDSSDDEEAQTLCHDFIDGLKATLAQGLPDYMVPSAFVVLTALPLTPNGKVDRKGLPAPDMSLQQKSYVAPTTETERQLCEIWQEVLDLEQVGVTDNFFELGGHSLLVMTVIARAQQVNLAITAKDFFAAPQLSVLAAELDRHKANVLPLFSAPENIIPADCQHITPEMLPLIALTQEEITHLASLVPGGMENIQDIYPLGPLQEGILFTHMVSDNNDPYVLPTLFEVKGEEAVSNFVDSLGVIINRHDVLRTAVLWEGLATPVQVVCKDVVLPVTWLDLGEGVNVQRHMAELILPENQWLDLTQAPLIALRIAKSHDDGRYFLLLQFHHLITDHVGLEIIQHELSVLSAGQAEALAPVVPYRNFIAHTLHQAKAHDAQRYFTDLLGDIDEPTAPFGLLDVQGDGTQIVELREAVPAHTAERLRAVAKSLALSPASVFHAAFGMVVAACSGRESAVFGSVMSGRLQGVVGAESMLGVFINTLPVRLDIDDTSVLDFVLNTQQRLRDLLPFEQASLALTQSCSGLANGSPLFSAILNYRHSARVDHGVVTTEPSNDHSIAILAGQERTNYPFNLNVDDWGTDFEFDFQVDGSVDVERVMAYMQTALVQLVECLRSSPDKPVRGLSVMRVLYADPEQSLPDTIVSFRDYVLGYQSLKDTQRYKRAKEYWSARLSDFSGRPELPLALAPSEVGKPSFERRQHILEDRYWQILKRNASTHRATPTVVIIACLSKIIELWSQNSKFVLNLTLFNRDPSQENIRDQSQENINSIVGDFTTTTLLEIDNSLLAESFSDGVKRIQHQLWNDLEHKDFDGLEVQQLLKQEHEYGLGFPIVVTSSLGLEMNDELAQQNSIMSGVDARFAITQTPQVWLDIQLYESEQGLCINWDSVEGLFPVGVLDAMCDATTHLMQALSNDEKSWSLKVPNFFPQQQSELIQRVNNTDVPVTSDVLHSAIMCSIATYPDNIAIVSKPKTLTYRELGVRSSQLTCQLAATQGARQPVAVVMQKGWEQIVAVLGVLRSGRAYVPIDAQLPAKRIAVLLEICGAEDVITTPNFREIIPELYRCHLVQEKIDDELSEPVVDIVSPESTAYIIFTSGTTGVPKGVAIKHISALNTVLDINRRFNVTTQDSVLGLSSLSFDLSVYDIFGILGAGGRLILPTPAETKDPLAWSDYLAEHRVTFWNTAPALMNLFANALQKNERFSDLRIVMLSGDWIPTDLPIRIAAFSPQASVISLGGATEASIWSIAHEIREVSSEWVSIPYGKALANQKMMVLRNDLSHCPLWVMGDIYISGIGLAEGYWQDQEKTAASFVWHPETGERLYKTGDKGLLRPCGNIEFLGRVDSQVKIQGHRIELGEVEAVFRNSNVLRDVLVVARDEPKRLVAYIVADNDEADLIDPLRAHLKSQLPDFMIPAVMMLVPTIPLTSNGKVDRSKLPEPDISLQQKSYVAPTTETEKQLCEIWQEVLDLEQVGVTDNFFELGGHSLLAMTVIAKAQQLNLAIRAKDFFTAPQLSALAAELDRNKANALPMFTAPENIIPADCQQITPEMLPLIALTQEEIAHVASLVPGGMENIQDIYPLGPLQEGILFTHMMSNKSDPYVLPTLFEVKGEQAVDDFIGSLGFIINRHDVLRTAVLWEGLATPVQVVCKDVALPVTWLDLDEDINVEHHMTALTLPENQWLDLTQAPLLALRIAKSRDEGRYFLLLQFHHVISDHVGLEIIQHELSVLSAGQAEALAPVVPYRNFIAHTLHQAKAHDAQGYFTDLLGDIDEPTAPFGLLDVQGDGTQIVELREAVPAHTAERLRAVAKSLALSPASVFHAAFGMVVAACSGRESAVFGSVMSGRLQGVVGAESMLGVFINTLPVRLDIDDTSVLDFVLNTQQRLRDLLPFEQASLALTQGCSGLANNSPLFSAMLNYRHSTVADNSAVNAEPSNDHSVVVLAGQERTNYPFNLSVDDWGAGFEFDFQVDKSVDVGRVMAYMQTAVLQLVDGLTSSPDKPVRGLSVLPPAELHQQLIEWNDTQVDYPKDSCIHELFEQQVSANADAVAVVFEDKQLTYGELNQQANQLAHYLIEERQVTPDTLAGICVERSLDMIVGIMGILKAGGAYVPLDPSYPAARLAYMLDDANVTTVLTHTSLQGQTPVSESQAVVLDSDEMLEQLQSYPSDNVIVKGLTSSHLAYVIYTSGSTGNPKGVMIEHSAAYNYLCFAVKHYCQNIQGGVVSTSLNFDATLTSIFSPLVCGKYIHLLQSGSMDFGGLIDMINQATHPLLFKVTPVHLDAMKNTVQIAQNNNLAHVFIVGGEEFKLQTLKYWKRELFSNAIFVNEFGPTEATVGCSTFEVSSSDDAIFLGSNISIGKPVVNTQLYILNDNLLVAPIGVAGELHIGGVGLARGYLNRPDLTAEKFIPNPLFDKINPSSSERLYKTGDLVRYLPGGNLEFLGRIDHQVKIRGFRIELGEIEHQLLTHDEVNDAVVVALVDNEGDKRLVAYVTHDDAAAMCSEDSSGEGSENEEAQTLRHDFIDGLKAALAQGLPDYMVPSAFVVLSALPLTANGKVDRKGLPAPDLSLQQKSYVAPATETERQLCEIWQDVLDLEQVGVTDNFFELGGHSLLVIKMMPLIKDALNNTNNLRQQHRDFSIPVIFQYPTISKSLAYLTSFQGNGIENPVKMNAASKGPKLFLFHEMSGLISPSFPLADAIGEKFPVYGFEAVGNIDLSKDCTTIRSLAKKYKEDIKRVQPEGPYNLAGWSLGGTIAYEVAVQLFSEGEIVGFLGLIDSCKKDGFTDWDADQFRRHVLDRQKQVLNSDLIEAMLRNLQLSEDIPLINNQNILTALNRHKIENDSERELEDANHVIELINTYHALSIYANRHFEIEPLKMVINLYAATNEETDMSKSWGGFLDIPPAIKRVDSTHQTIIQKPCVEGIADDIVRNLMGK